MIVHTFDPNTRADVVNYLENHVGLDLKVFHLDLVPLIQKYEDGITRRLAAISPLIHIGPRGETMEIVASDLASATELDDFAEHIARILTEAITEATDQPEHAEYVTIFATAPWSLR